MATPQGMEIYAARLASFDIAQPTTKKKRASGAKGAKTSKWPHKSPSPAGLARAGFFYVPTTSCLDNVVCFVCEKSLDGWEKDDDPIKEHLNYAPECGWAINMAIEQEVEVGIHEDEDPMSAKMLEARKSTFGDRWPHKNKRGWTCKVPKMIEAGWYHCPTAESDDFVKCAYCSLSLDGWEPKDNPFEEHQRRSPECAFFTLSQSKIVKPTRVKQGRPSKASRTSAQSNATAELEDLSMLDAAAEKRDSIATTAVYMATASTNSKIVRQAGRARMDKGKAQSKAVKTAMMEEMTQNSSFVEPEDDDFEVKVHTDSNEDHRGKKRLSSEMEANDPPLKEAAGDAKRRATRTRSSTNRPQIVPEHAAISETASDTYMSDNKDIPPPTLPLSKNGGKLGRKRGSSAARKVSDMSTASKASLRAVPTDTEIDAALEADLNRPLTDDEAEQEVFRGPKTRRLTRSRPKSMQLSASVVPPFPTTQSSTSSVEDNQVEISVEISKMPEIDVALGAIDEDLQSISTSLEEGYSTTVKTITRKAKGKAKVSATRTTTQNQDILTVEKEHSTVHQSTAIEVVLTALDNTLVNEADGEKGDTTQESLKRSAAPPRLKQSKSRQPSHQLTGRDKAELIVSATDTPSELQVEIETPVLSTEMVADNLLFESDPSPMTEARLNPGGKKGKASKKGEKSKKVESPSQQIESILPTSINKADEDHFLLASQNIESEEGGFTLGISRPLALTTNFEETPTARENSAGQVKIAQEGEKAPKGKRGRARPKSKASSSGSQLTQKQDERAPKPQAPPSQKPSKTNTGAVETMASPPRFTAAFSSTSRPPAPKPVVPSPIPSPQSSDAENQPPSSRPSQQRPPLFETSPSRSQAKRIPLAVSTPTTSPSRPHVPSSIETTFPWTTVDIENILLGTPKLAQPPSRILKIGLEDCLSSPEKKMTLEEWIQFNANTGEKNLRNECERLVGRFEGEGNRALKALEGVICSDS